MFYKLEGVIIMNQFQFFKLLFFLFLVLFIYQCEDAINDPALNDSDSASLLKGGKGGGNGGGGNGGGGNGGVTDYGELIVCLRDADGVPVYELIEGEHGIEYFALPIKFDETTMIPVKDTYGDYEIFTLNIEGEVIPETGYVVKEADFGRLSIVRAPQTVLDAALQEAINGLTQSDLTYITTDASGRLIAIIGAEDWIVNYDTDPSNDEDNDKTIDSPRENMAIYQELMTYGLSNYLDFLFDDGYFTEDDVIDLAIGAMAAAADKTGNITVDEVAYLNDWTIDWDLLTEGVEKLIPDEKGKNYFNFGSFQHSRASIYANKYVRITTLNQNGTWDESIESLLDVVPWTHPDRLMDWSGGANDNITGFANAVDDAIQVLEFIHESDLVVYSPGFVVP